MMTQNTWDTAKAVVRGKFTATQSHLRKQENCQINNLNLHPKQPEKEQQTKPKVYQKERYHKDQSTDKWNRDKQNRKDQWN